VPHAGAELAAYGLKLDRVSRALDLAHEAYAAGLAERDELAGLVGAVGAMAAATQLSAEARADLAELRDRLDAVLDTPPVALDRARALVAAYQSYLTAATRPTRHGKARP
jgi:hypothetical protein